MTDNTLWLPETAAHYHLSRGEVHIWRTDLSAWRGKIVDYWSLLSTDEKERAQRYKFAIHQERFILSRGTLRLLLAQYLKQPAADIPLTYNPQGKPQHPQLEFNNSDSQQLALYAFSLSQPVGIDIEYKDQDIAAEALAKRFFAEEEHTALQALPVAERKVAFFNLWTRKEAFIKAIGKGLSFSLQTFAVNLEDDVACLSHIQGDRLVARDWSLVPLYPHPEFAAALAVRGEIRQVCQFFL